MPNPDLIPEPFAQSGDKNTIPLERAIADPIYRASWKAGFPPDTRIPKDVGGEAPDGLDFNGVLNILSQAVVFLQKGNAYQFDASMAPYPIGALVRSNDNLTTYQSTVVSNSNNPNSNMTGWRVYNGSGFIVDNLTTNDSAKALSAAQGKKLQDEKFAIANLVNDLTTGGIDKALTAEQGKALNDKLIGVGQSWQDLTSSRSKGVTYTNNTGRPIQVKLICGNVQDQFGIQFYVGSSMFDYPDIPQGIVIEINFTIPAGNTYRATGNDAISYWWELR